MNTDISKSALKALMKRKGVDKLTSITPAEYRELLLGSKVPSKTSKKSSRKKQEYSFVLDGSVTEYGFELVFMGKHLAKNSVNSLSFKDKIRYKNAFKEAMNVFHLTKWRKDKFDTLEKVNIEIDFHNPVSRDPDANMENIKFAVDVCTRLKLIVDDNRGVVKSIKEDEVISKEYKIVLRVFNIP